MLKIDLWHGAAWSYAVWGSFHGLALVVERFLTEKIKLKSNFLFISFKRIVVFIFVTIAWLLFKLTDFSQAIDFIKCVFTNYNINYDWNLCINIFIYSFFIFLYHLSYLLKEKKIIILTKRYEFVYYGFMLFLILANSGSSGSFIYFQF